MNNFALDIFSKIAKRFGFELTTKTETVNDFYDVNNISMTAVMSDRIATLTLAESSVDVEGTSERAKELNSIATNLFEITSKETIVAQLGTGDCLIVPVTDGKYYGADIIENRDFYITNSIGGKIIGVVIKRDSIVKDNHTYERYEYQALEELDGVTVCFIRQIAYKDDKEIDLNSVQEWMYVPKEQYITNVDRLLLGRFKCPTVNRENINSTQGVPITYGLSVAVEKAKESYMRFNEEYKKKETKIFADKTLFKKSKDKDDYYIPDDGLYQLMRSNTDGQLPIKEFSPQNQFEELKGAVEFNFKMLETFAGLSTGVLSEADADIVTATAIRASLQNTFAFITKIRTLYARGFEDFIYACNMLMNKNDKVGGSYELSFDWSDKMMEATLETFNMLLQSLGMDIISKAEMRSWMMNEKLSVSEKWIEENAAATNLETDIAI